MARISKGRQKIEITRMANESHRLVTFSKRRSGLFKKASELSTLCGVDIAVIVFSPARKVFSFGHPSVESIINRYLARSNPVPNSNPTLQLVEAHRNASIHQLNAQLSETISRLEVEKKRGEELDKMRKVGQETNWWEAPVDDLGLEELEKLKMAMEELKNGVAKQKMLMEVAASANATSFFPASFSSYGEGVGNVGLDANDGTGVGPSMMPHRYALGYGSGVGHVGPSVMDNSQLGLPVMPPYGYTQGYDSGVGHVAPSSSSGVMDNNQLGLPVMPPHGFAQGYGSGVGHVGPSSSGVMMPPHGFAQGDGSGVGHVGPSSSGVMDNSQLGLPVMPPHGYGRGFF